MTLIFDGARPRALKHARLGAMLLWVCAVGLIFGACSAKKRPEVLVAPVIEAPKPRLGVLVEPGTYERHRRVLWDVGWDSPDWNHTYNEHPKGLRYRGRSLFLGPLKGYGVPDPQPGAERWVRLYVNYGHQWMCKGTPTVAIGDVHFHLPNISGHYADVGAHYSDFRTASEFDHVRHAPISVFLKDFAYGGDHCGPPPGNDRPKGVIMRIEAVHYDVFPTERPADAPPGPAPKPR